jgi:hypothetical protein
MRAYMNPNLFRQNHLDRCLNHDHGAVDHLGRGKSTTTEENSGGVQELAEITTLVG